MKCISLSKQSLCWLQTQLQHNYVKILSFVQQQQQVQPKTLSSSIDSFYNCLVFKTLTMTICEETRKLFVL